MVTAIEANVVTAAAAGDPAALERLVSEYLPLVYNVVGRALPVAADVDDVVQETMLCVVRGLPTLRDTDAFRSWLVVVAMNQTRTHVRGYGARPRPLDAADPGADFADLTLTELGLTGQRREVAMATSWLDLDDRELLSLWWLAEAGHLTRGEVVTATGPDPQHVTVRVARMKAQLDVSRAVVRALCTAPICPGLAGVAVRWPRRPEPLWRKRFEGHIRECPACAALAIDFVPAERLLVGLPLLPVPFALTDAVYRQIAGALQAGVLDPVAASFQPTQVYEEPAPSYGHQPPIGPAESTALFDPFEAFDPFEPSGSIDQPPTVPIASVSGRPPGPHSHRRIPQSGARTAASHLAAKAAVALAATAAVVGAAVVAANFDNADPEPQASGAPDAVLSSAPGTSPDPSASATSSVVVSSAGTSSASGPSTSHRSSAKPAPSTSQSLVKSPSSSGGNSAAATSAGNPPAPSSSATTSATTSTTPPPPPSSSSTSPSSSSPGQVSPEDQVLALINQARADQGLPPLTRTAGLDKSAAGHTSVMASTCGLSHQCPGEPGLGARETAAGVLWTSAGENIGDGGPVADSNDAIASMALGLTKSMLAERPPGDGHRRNILSSGFHHIGISVYRDSNGTVWMTQDFSD